MAIQGMAWASTSIRLVAGKDPENQPTGNCTMKYQNAEEAKKAYDALAAVDLSTLSHAEKRDHESRLMAAGRCCSSYTSEERKQKAREAIVLTNPPSLPSMLR
jgi:hypothetical protein